MPLDNFRTRNQDQAAGVKLCVLPQAGDALGFLLAQALRRKHACRNILCTYIQQEGAV
jgi:hypothetical protein